VPCEQHRHGGSAEVARHRLIDVGVGRARLRREQRGGGHELTRLAVAALRNVELTPRALQWMFARRVEPLDGRDLRLTDVRHRDLTRPRRLSVVVNGTGAALADAAAVLGADEPERIPQDPEQRSIRRDVDRVSLAVHAE